MKKRWLIPLFLIFLLAIDHKVKHGYWYDVSDFKSHEALGISLLGVMFGMVF